MSLDRHANRGLLIQRLAHVKELFCLLARPAQRAIFLRRFDPLPTQIERRIEPDTHAIVLVDQLTIDLRNPGATAERDHTLLAAFEELVQDLCFDRAKSRFAVFANKLGGGSSVLVRDHAVEVHHWQSEPARECACDCGFAATHKTDDDDWTGGFHRWISESSSLKNSGKETATDSEPWISVSPSAMSAATEKAMAMR